MPQPLLGALRGLGFLEQCCEVLTWGLRDSSFLPLGRSMPVSPQGGHGKPPALSAESIITQAKKEKGGGECVKRVCATLSPWNITGDL